MSAAATSPPGSRAPTPDAWHPDDELFVPMLHSDGHMLGILSVGEPYTGGRPSDEELEVLVAVADHVALALQSFQEEAAAAHHRIALRELLQVSSRLAETRRSRPSSRRPATGSRTRSGSARSRSSSPSRARACSSPARRRAGRSRS